MWKRVRLVRKVLAPAVMPGSAWRSRLLIPAALGLAVVAGGHWTAHPAAAASRRHATKKQPPVDLTASFQVFCAQWMEKVWAREAQNIVTWEKDGDSMEGTYTQYGRQYTCTVTKSSPPVGKVSYRETRYEKRGKTVPDAERSTPQPVEAFDTDEYFTYLHGKWQ